MRMCLLGSSFDDNLKHNIYFHPAEKRGYSFKPIEYIGLYKDKEKWTNLLNEPHYYYLIEDFIETDYKKTSKGGSMGVKYFNVNEILNRDCLTTEQIAKELCNKDWE